MKIRRKQNKKSYTRTRSSSKSSSKSPSKYNYEVFGILLLGLGVLMLFSLYYKNSIGVFGNALRSFSLGIMGTSSFIIPPLVIIYSIFVFFKKDSKSFKLRMLYAFALLLLLSALVHTSVYDEVLYENVPILGILMIFYRNGASLDSFNILDNGGGVLGGLISLPLLATFQVLGTIIILSSLAIVTTILLTNVSISNFILNLKLKIMNKAIAVAKTASELEEQNAAVRSNLVVLTNKDNDLTFNKKPVRKIIDFDLEKNWRGSKNNPVIDVKEVINEVEPVEFIMKDSKQKTIPKVAPEVINEVVSVIDKAMHEKSEKSYVLPSINLLDDCSDSNLDIKAVKNAALEGAKKLEDTLRSFGVEAKVINVSRGPTVTRYELQPSSGVKVKTIVNLADDISLNLAASGVRIEAPIPGKAAIGIEVANKDIMTVHLREVIDTTDFTEFPSKIAFAIGKDISGDNIVADIGKMPHLLIAGATGSGKSVCINSLILSILYKASPKEVKLLMIDPKVVELGIYNGIPHLLIPVVTDPKKASGALNWAVQEMINRYKLFAEKGARDLKGYNLIIKEEQVDSLLPQVVIIIDELADLMMVAPNDVEDAICRLAQMARAAGMHLVIATQRPSVDVITGVIKANIPSRISFAVSSQVDSRTILDMAGAERLLGKGDMLFHPMGKSKPIRVQGAFVSEKEIEKIVNYTKLQGNTEYNASIIEQINNVDKSEEDDPGDNDELLSQAIEIVVEMGQASVSLIQRKFKVGYARAGRIIDQMETRGIVGRSEGSKPRQVLLSRQQWQEMQMADKE